MSADFYFENLDEFRKKLDIAVKEYTESAERHLQSCGNKLKKRAQENTPSSGQTRKNGKGKTIKPLSKSWKGKITGLSANDIQYELRNTSKVHHLVERGHVQKTPGGRVTGFTQGKHFFDKVVNDFKASNEIEGELEKFMQEVKKKLE